MESLHKRGVTWQRDKLPTVAVVLVEIRNATEAIESVEATPGRRDFQQYLVEEAAGTAEVWDWIIAEQNLIFPIAGKQQPADGWEIRVPREDGGTAVFIARPEIGGGVFTVHDPYGLMYRIHTKFDRIES